MTTAEHPFYVESLGSFVPAPELAIGDVLALADGPKTTAFVTDIQVQRGSPPHGTPTYGWGGSAYQTFNLEVDGFHTYFVGEVGGGMWVHNIGGNECQRVVALFTRLMQKHWPDNPVAAYTSVRNKLPNMTDSIRRGLVDEVLDTIDEMNDLGTLDPHLRELGLDIGSSFRRSEAFAGHRYEALTGRTLRRPGPGESGAFVDDGFGIPPAKIQWDAKGQTPSQSNVEGFVNSLRQHVILHPLGDEGMLIDTAGLTGDQIARIRTAMYSLEREFNWPYYMIMEWVHE